MDCLFCSIVERDIPADIVFADDKVVAFRDVNPQAPTHILIIPRQHIATINDVDQDNAAIISHMTLTAKALAAEQGHAEDGYRLVFNCNGDGGQTVFHIHMHLLGGRQLGWPPG